MADGGGGGGGFSRVYEVPSFKVALAYLNRVDRWAGHMIASTKIKPDALESEYQEVVKALKAVESCLRKAGML